MINPQRTFDELDTISRSRALTLAESMRLECAIKILDAQKNPPKFCWNTAKEARLVECIEIQGMTFSQAAAALGCTRDAAIGKFSRIRGWRNSSLAS